MILQCCFILLDSFHIHNLFYFQLEYVIIKTSHKQNLIIFLCIMIKLFLFFIIRDYISNKFLISFPFTVFQMPIYLQVRHVSCQIQHNRQKETILSKSYYRNAPSFLTNYKGIYFM